MSIKQLYINVQRTWEKKWLSTRGTNICKSDLKYNIIRTLGVSVKTYSNSKTNLR